MYMINFLYQIINFPFFSSGFPFTDGMMALFSARVPLGARPALLLAAERLTAERWLSCRILQESVVFLLFACCLS